MIRFAALPAFALLATAAHAGDASVILAANKAASGGAAWDGKETLKVDYDYRGDGLTGTASSLEDLRQNRFVDTSDTPPETGADGYDGTRPWLRDMSGTVAYQEGGDTPELSVNEAYRDRNLWWSAGYGGAAIASEGKKPDGGASYDVLDVTPKNGAPFEAWFDTNTHLLVKTVEVQGPQTITTRFSDYRDVEGAKLAGKLVVDDGSGPKYAQTLTLKAARFLPAQPASAYARPDVKVTDYAIAGGSETTIPFRLMNNHIYADVRVDGKGPFLFIFDTGGHNNLVPATIKTIGLKTQGDSRSGGAGEGMVDASDAVVDTLQVGNATLTHQLVGVLDFEKPETAGYTTEGMIGVQTFRRFVTRFDYGAHTITLIDPAHFDPKDAGTPVPIVFDGQIPVVRGTFEGITGNFDIDTGSRDELSLTRPFAEAQNLRATHPKGVEGVDGWGVGGPSHAYVTRGKSLTIGPVALDNIVTSLSTDKRGAFAAKSYQGNIGSGILKRFVVTFDYPHETMYLKRLPEPVADAGVYDRAGMWINADPQGFRIVDVSKNAPAEDAGLKVDDVITSVDGRTASGIHLYDLRQRLRDDPAGTIVTLTVQHGRETKSVKLTLRYLI